MDPSELDVWSQCLSGPIPQSQGRYDFDPYYSDLAGPHLSQDTFLDPYFTSLRSANAQPGGSGPSFFPFPPVPFSGPTSAVGGNGCQITEPWSQNLLFNSHSASDSGIECALPSASTDPHFTPTNPKK